MGDTADHVGLKIAEVLSMAYTDNSLNHFLNVLDAKSQSGELTHRNIRTLLEKEYISKSYGVLERLGPLYESLTVLNACVDHATQLDEEMATLLDEEVAKTSDFAAEAIALEREKSTAEAKIRSVRTYRDIFQLSDEDAQILGSLAGGLNDAEDERQRQRFFSIFAKAKRMYSECDVLMAEYPRAGEHAMTELSKHLEKGYTKVKWTLDQHLKGDVMGRKLPLRKYMALLADRPIMFKAVLDELSSTRRSVLTLEFQQQQAHRGSRANDDGALGAVASIGELCAWVHAAIVNEYENVSMLIDAEIDEHIQLNQQNGGEVDLATRSLSELMNTTDARKIIVEAVDSITGPALESPFRQRVTSLVLRQTDPVVVDELSGVLQFYTQILAKYSQTTLMATFSGLNQVIERQFQHCLVLRLEAAKKIKSEMQVPDDKHPPEFMESAVYTAASVLKKFEQGVSREVHGSHQKIQDRLSAILDQSIGECEKIANGDAIYMLNCLDVVKTHLAGYVMAVEKLEGLEGIINENIQAQIRHELEWMEQTSGIVDVRQKNINGKQFSERFDEFLSNANFDLAQHLDNLASPSMVNSITQGAATAFLDSYAPIAEELKAPRTVEDVRTLLL